LELVQEPRMTADASDRHYFESTIQALEAELANAGAHLTIDAAARLSYSQQVRAMADDLRNQVVNGRLTWRQAAEEAQQTRNVIMELLRGRSTPVGRALAERLKPEGRTLNQLVAKKAVELFGADANFAKLSAQQQDSVYAAIVKSAGKSDPAVNALMRRASRAGRGLLVLSLAVSVYNVATAQDKLAAGKREALVTGAGLLGGAAGGAIAGLACGPGAPVCVTVGAFIGGALAAFGVDLF
jgi:hypothetical protein